MVEVVWTDESLSWLREIYDYISADNPSAARQVIDGILARVEQLSMFPDAGAKLETPRGDLRMLLYGHYRIVYRRPKEDRIEIIGVYHGALDIARRLESDEGNDTIHD